MRLEDTLLRMDMLEAEQDRLEQLEVERLLQWDKQDHWLPPGTEAAVRYDGRANGVVDEGHEGGGNVHDDGVEVHDGVGDEDEDDDDDQMVHQQRGYEPCLFSCSQMLLLPPI